MKSIVYFLLLGFVLLSCKRELSQDERDKLRQDSIHQKILAMGMNADSSFSYRKYNKALNDYYSKDSLMPEPPFDFAEDQFIFYNDTLIYYYNNEFPYDDFCGTPSFQAERNKEIYEEFKVKKKDLILIKSDTIIDFIKRIEQKTEKDKRIPKSIIIGINKDSIKSKELQKLRKYLINTDFRYVFRPLSTRERLVADAKFNNTSEDFSKVNWDSAYHEDYKKFYPEN
ncbi:MULTISPECIES: hypothetical protein [Empedobacter]|uniref:hypothetical protein n=1 Tax=Empedobacter TaxID=59734 RepID=UPI0025766082|nr:MULTISPECIES: hypothetical protein [Empedobacter]MDM1041389.1 hypothetical protein [Empedobacter brevis]MDM1134968.1 hypothetical protein [Empedobacter sp. R750]